MLCGFFSDKIPVPGKLHNPKKIYTRYPGHHQHTARHHRPMNTFMENNTENNTPNTRPGLLKMAVREVPMF